MEAKPAIEPDVILRLQRAEGYLASDPSNAALLALAIDLSLQVLDVARAAAHAEQARACHPDDPYLQFHYAHVLLAQGKTGEAAPMFADLLAVHRSVNVAYGLAACQLREGAWAAALATLAPFRHDPALPAEAVTLMVRALHHLADYPAALALVDAFRERLQDDASFCAAASLLCLDMGRFDQAAGLAESVLSAGARPIEALVTSATVALGRMETGPAVERFTEALTLNPAEGRSWSGLGMASMLRGEMALAKDQFERAVHFMPSHIGSWHGLGWSKVLTQDLGGAAQAFSAALAIDRNFGESHGALAVVAAQQGEGERARSGIDIALRLDKECLSARYAQMVLEGKVADPERFKAIALRLIRSHKTPAGEDLASVVQRMATH